MGKIDEAKRAYEQARDAEADAQTPKEKALAQGELQKRADEVHKRIREQPPENDDAADKTARAWYGRLGSGDDSDPPIVKVDTALGGSLGTNTSSGKRKGSL